MLQNTKHNPQINQKINTPKKKPYIRTINTPRNKQQIRKNYLKQRLPSGRVSPVEPLYPAEVLKQ